MFDRVYTVFSEYLSSIARNAQPRVRFDRERFDRVGTLICSSIKLRILFGTVGLSTAPAIPAAPAALRRSQRSIVHRLLFPGDSGSPFASRQVHHLRRT